MFIKLVRDLLVAPLWAIGAWGAVAGGMARIDGRSGLGLSLHCGPIVLGVAFPTAVLLLCFRPHSKEN